MEHLFFHSHHSPKKQLDTGPSQRAMLKLADALSRKQKVYEYPEEFIRTPFDPHIFSEAKGVAERVWTSQVKFVAVVGIGGSNLGVKAVYDAVRGNWGQYRHLPQALFFDTCDARGVEEGIEYLEREVAYSNELVINLISKSGATAESVINMDHIIDRLRKKFPNILERFVITTDKDSPLYKYGEKHGVATLVIPGPIGGRYSVFTPVGLLPLILLGADVEMFRSGAQETFSSELTLGADNARIAAESIYRSYLDGSIILNQFFFNPEFESLGKWGRQLIGESLGKKHTREGKTANIGIMPVVSIGSTDLHSMAQLYFGGPKNVYTLLIRSPREKLPPPPVHFSKLANIEGKSASDVMDAIYQGVLQAYKENELPYAELVLPKSVEFAAGSYMAFLMLVVYFLAEFLRVNPFDQPNVEDYKRVTRRLLEGS